MSSLLRKTRRVGGYALIAAAAAVVALLVGRGGGGHTITFGTPRAEADAPLVQRNDLCPGGQNGWYRAVYYMDYENISPPPETYEEWASRNLNGNCHEDSGDGGAADGGSDDDDGS